MRHAGARVPLMDVGRADNGQGESCTDVPMSK